MPRYEESTMTDETVWLKPNQVQAIRDACYSDVFGSASQSRNDAIIALLYDTGLRPAEAVAVTRGMFHPDEPSIRLTSSIQKQYPNSGTPPAVTIELCQDSLTSDTARTVQNWLNSRSDDSMYLFTSRQGNSLSTRRLRQVVKKAAVEAGIEPYVGHAGRGDPSDVTPYALRHSVAYRMLSVRDDGTTMYDVRNRLRHSSIETTEDNYDHFDSV